MYAAFVTLWLQVVQPLANVHETKWTPHVKRQSDVAQSCNSSVSTKSWLLYLGSGEQQNHQGPCVYTGVYSG